MLSQYVGYLGCNLGTWEKNKYDETEEKNLNGQIQWYLVHQHEVMGHGYQFLAEIDLSKVPTMRNKTKKRRIKKLDIIRAVCERERETTGRRQNLITQYVWPPRREEDLEL